MTVKLEDMMLAREERVKIQTQLINKYHDNLICLTMNIPGPIKVDSLIKKCFFEGVKLLNRQLYAEKIMINDEIYNLKETGYEYYVSLKGNKELLKEITIFLEETQYIGRLFDFDVIDKDKNKISRVDFNISERKCIICDNNALICSRSRSHNLQELNYNIHSRINKYLTNDFLIKTTKNAVNALITEVMISPKPGLVDRFNTGSHNDMDCFTFVNSSCVLFDSFYNFLKIGLESNNISYLESVKKLIYCGRNAESIMFEETNGINTHKGAIFSMSCFLFCLGKSYPDNTLDNLRNNLLELSKTIDELKMNLPINTNGSLLYKSNRCKGLRGELKNGYKTVFEHSLPLLERFLDNGLSLNDASILVLLELVVSVDDSNLIARSNEEIANNIKIEIKEYLNTINNYNIHELSSDLNEKFMELNLSPGGCADLLALTIFLKKLIDQSILN